MSVSSLLVASAQICVILFGFMLAWVPGNTADALTCDATMSCTFSSEIITCTGFADDNDKAYVNSLDTSYNGWTFIYGQKGTQNFCCEHYAGGGWTGHVVKVVLETAGGADHVYLDGSYDATYAGECAYFPDDPADLDDLTDVCSDIDLGGGNDTIYGSDYTATCSGWSDIVDCGSGDDIVEAGYGDDWVGGELGDDTIDGGQGNDRLYGDDGEDYLTGGFGSDEINGGDDIDTIFGGEGDDYLCGDADSDQDIIYGGPERYPGSCTNQCSKYGEDNFVSGCDDYYASCMW